MAARPAGPGSRCAPTPARDGRPPAPRPTRRSPAGVRAAGPRGRPRSPSRPRGSRSSDSAPDRRLGKLAIDVAVVAKADGLALDDQHVTCSGGLPPGRLVLAHERGAPFGIALAVDGRAQRRDLGQRGLQPLAGPAQGRRLLADDLLLDLLVRLLARHSTITDSTSQCWRSRKRTTVSTVRASAALSRLMRSLAMWRTSG